MTTSKDLGISVKYGDQSGRWSSASTSMLSGVRVPQGDNLRLALLRK
jgi:hypothetical protein